MQAYLQPLFFVGRYGRSEVIEPWSPWWRIRWVRKVEPSLRVTLDEKTPFLHIFALHRSRHGRLLSIPEASGVQLSLEVRTEAILSKLTPYNCQCCHLPRVDESFAPSGNGAIEM